MDEYELFEFLEEDYQNTRNARLQRRQLRDQSNPFALEETHFIKRYRLTKDLVSKLCEELRPFMNEPTKSQDLSIETKVLVALAFYATGSYQRVIGDMAGHSVAQETVSTALKQITKCLNLPYFREKYIKFPRDSAQRRTNTIESLLLAAFVISNCITWTASRHHYTHNVSGHRSRHRRQGAGLFLSASYVLPGGEGTGWGEWGEVSPCSRTCGGGVASQKRICLQIGPDGQPQCSGGDTKYFSCQTQDCPAGSKDFREQQCSEFDDVAFRDIKYRWVPYTQAPNPCELNCMPHGERFYYRHRTKVVDGTRCNDESFDVCVNGTCQPVGCDMMLGSTAREDKCRECRGNGANCQTTVGVLDTQDLRKGYNDMLLIPEGATTIVIAERAPSINYLALRAKNGTYYLNGEYHIDFPRSLTIAGALWYYERSQQGFAAPDKLRCLGPTNEPLYLALLLQDENVGIDYEYSVPNELAPPRNKRYNWVHEEFTPCSAACGGGFQTRNVSCRSREELELVDEGLCEREIKPPINQTCNTEPCAPQWSPGPWGACSKRCGKGGTRAREVHCTQIITNGYPSIVADKSCFDLLGPKPELFQECNDNATCPLWFAGPWKPCDKLCDKGKQTRKVVCYQKNGRRIEVLGDDECEDEKPAEEQTCMLQPCDGVDWVVSDWSGCDTCVSTVRSRTAFCATKAHAVVNDSFCSYHKAPETQEPCDKDKLPPCDVQWYATQWTKCSVLCGKGVQTREVFCGLYDGSSVSRLDDNRCAGQTKYNSTKECEIPKDKCPSQWFSGPWSACTKKCGGGEQFRRVMCLRGEEAATDCDGDVVLDSTQSCNHGPCDKDELLPVDEKSPAVTDDYDDCVEEEEDYSEVGVEVDSSSSSTMDDFMSTMFSDSPTEGSGMGSSTAEHESTFDTDSTLSSEEFFTTESGSGFTDTDITDTTEDDSGYESTTDLTDTGSTSNDTDATEETGSTESTVDVTGSSETEETGPTVTDETSETEETSESGSTESTEATLSTETSLGSSSSDSTESDTTESDSTEKTESTITGETSESSNESDSSTLSTETTGSTETEESTIAESTEDTSETESSSSTSSEETSESEATSDTASTESELTSETESTVEASTESGATDETTETGSTQTEETSETSSTDTTEISTTEATETTETGSTEPSETTETGSTEPSETTETGSTEPTETTATGSTELTETTETGSTEPTETGSTETTESGTTDETETTETGSTEPTETGSTESTETTETGNTEATETTETGSTEPTETTETGSTEPTETGSTETTETGTTEPTETTEMGSTEGTETTESGSTISTELDTGSTESTVTDETTTEITGSTETTEEGSTLSSEGTESSTTEASTEGLTRWDLSSTMEAFTTTQRARVCRPRSCKRSEFGCCPDKKTPALGPFDDGCPKPHTCKESIHGCCPDGVSPAQGPRHMGCPIEPCAETLFGCCESDNKTSAEGNDQEGCPPPPPACLASKYGCCKDGETEATGPDKEGCPETSTTVTDSEETETSTSVSPTEALEGCVDTEYGCCFDNETVATGPELQGCPCNTSEFGCCPDGVAPAQGPNFEGCVKSCNTTTYGCCPDGKTPAHGVDQEGCCLLYAYGCCPDNYKPADGPHLEGCGCQYSRFGCCPDNVTVATGLDNKGCGCQYTDHGCCPDRHSEASGPEFEGCKCHTYQFGCCPDGVTVARGPNGQGCYCQQSTFGCCGDEQTHAKGANKEGCDCSTSKHGCCPDGTTEATGPKFEGCTDKPENKQAACSLKFERGPCRNYSVNWFYDTEYGGCSRFWYGGCEGNGNRFGSKEECEDTCVSPPPKDACKLPQIKGACLGYNVRWYYDNSRETCTNFVYGGCLGNSNNFETRELCQAQCEPERALDQCSLAIERGTCAGNYPRWGFNKETRRCEQFVWGGCEGNSNRFSTEAACLLRCNPPGEPQPECSEPQDVGNCTDIEALWSFSQSENRCVPFYYTGCGGNANRFPSQERCEDSCPSAFVPELCTLPASTGDCADYREKWYFDTKDQRCRQFYYGGCGGNGNKFDTEEECGARCSPPTTTPAPSTGPPAPRPDADRSDFCFLEIDAGPCNQLETKWGYDYTRGKCVAFQYGGCGGNQNNFPTEEHCTYYCKPAQDICQLPMLAGPCDDSVMQWFYDAASDSCSQFTYGGCEGNENRFNSREDCENRCKTGPAASPSTPILTTTTVKIDSRFGEPLPAECAISPELEECSSDSVGEVWYYDQATSACAAHQNLESGQECRVTGVFYSQEACERSCGVFRNIDVCRYPVEPGPCREYHPKYHYNGTSGRCEEFAYGGCLGGPNRFSSAQECQQICMAAADPCLLPPEPGNCVDRLLMWYYDQNRNQCYQFIYGGCGGNDNKFESREQCEGRCRRQPAVEVTTTTPVPVQTPRQQEPLDECRTPESLEPCGANIMTFYYDERSGRCAAADIGGCSHSNRYRTEEECERRCGAFKDRDVCHTQLDPGPCRASIPKFYFDAASGSCKPYAYGGCHGGPNRFSTSEECEEVCSAAGPETDESRICDTYAEECITLELTCETGVKKELAPEGCERCACDERANCDTQQRECDALQCTYGIERTTSEDGCERCRCFEDPCSRSDCASGERCVASAYRDPATQAVVYAAHCVPEVETNEVVPECESYAAECARLSCPFGVQRVRTARGCERCACVPQEVDCAPLRTDCDRLKCHYGLARTTGDDGCERCKCLEHPCSGKVCLDGERCVATPYRDPVTQEPRYSADCRSANKTGACPLEAGAARSTERACRRECADDADCRGVLKCCARGCDQLCVPPAAPPPPQPSTTHRPDIPQAPQVSAETEPEVAVAEGGKATLRCIFHGHPPPLITWRFGEITINSDVDRYRILSDGALEIISVFRNDSGVYVCVAANELGSARQEITLTVSDPVPAATGIAGGAGVVTGELGRAATVRCRAYGWPAPSIFWYRGHGGAMVPYSSALYEARGQELQIRRLTLDTLGEYECQAYNGVDRPATWRVTVQAYQPPDRVIAGNPYVVAREGPVVAVTPRPALALPPPLPATREPDLDIAPLTVPVQTKLVPSASQFSVGAQVSLPCEVDGFPDPDVRWTKDGAALQPSDRMWIKGPRLTIVHAEVNDSGEYSCHAANAYSSHTSTVRISVQEVYVPAKCVDNPTFANCALIVQSRFCRHPYYSKFCCKSCVEAGQLDPREVEMQADMPFRKK